MIAKILELLIGRISLSPEAARKIFSGRFLAFMMITATLCYCAITSINAVLGLTKVDPAVKDSIEKVAMFILGAFTTIATGMYKEYYDKNDRNKEAKQ